MKLKTPCKKCRKEFNLKKSYNTRPDLVDELGEYFTATCTHCLTKSEYHANDFTAFDTFSTNLIGSVIGVCIIVFTTLFAWDQGVITNVGFLIGAFIIGASNYTVFTSNSNAFNKYKVTRNPRKGKDQ